MPVVVSLVLAVLAVPTSSGTCVSREPTPQTGPGPHGFHVAPSANERWRDGDPGKPPVLDTRAEPVQQARVQILHADQDGRHDPKRWRHGPARALHHHHLSRAA